MDVELANSIMDDEGFEWLPGMRWIVFRDHPLDDVEGRISDSLDKKGKAFPPYSEDAIADFDDPATKGCLLELIRRKHGDPSIYVASFGDNLQPYQLRWYTRSGVTTWPFNNPYAVRDTELETMAGALKVKK